MVEGGRSNLLLDTSVLNVLAARRTQTGLKQGGRSVDSILPLLESYHPLSVTFGLFVTSVQTAGCFIGSRMQFSVWEYSMLYLKRTS